MKKSYFKFWMILILAFIILLIAEANAKILYSIRQIEISKSYDIIISIIKAFGFAFATIIIMISYRSWFIRSFFILCDISIIHVYLHYDVKDWWMLSSYVYPVFVGIIMAFIGHKAHEFLYKKDIFQHNGYMKDIDDLEKQIIRLKQLGRGKKWVDYPDIVDKVTNLEMKKKKILKLIDLN